MTKGAIIISSLLLLLTISSCATNQVVNSVCRHDAIYTGAIAIEQYPVQILTGPKLNDPKTWHAQTRVLIGIEWKWLNKTDKGYRIGKQEYFMVKEIYTFEGFVKYFVERYKAK